MYSYTTKATLNNTPIVIDSDATFGITPYVDNILLGALGEIDLDINNLSSKQKITARGFGRWTVQDKHYISATIEPFLYVVQTLKFVFLALRTASKD